MWRYLSPKQMFSVAFQSIFLLIKRIFQFQNNFRKLCDFSTFFCPKKICPTCASRCAYTFCVLMCTFWASNGYLVTIPSPKHGSKEFGHNPCFPQTLTKRWNEPQAECRQGGRRQAIPLYCIRIMWTYDVGEFPSSSLASYTSIFVFMPSSKPSSSVISTNQDCRQ